MIVWLLLVSLVCKSTQDGNGQDNGVLDFGPQNPTPASTKQVHNEAVTPDQMGSTRAWNLTSLLASECASQLAGLSPKDSEFVKNSKKPEVLPWNGEFEVGSRVTFCCFLPVGKTFDKMYLTGYDAANMVTTKISNQTYALSVLLNVASSESCTDVRCQTNDKSTNAACAFIGYPPDDRDLQCETRDLQSVECHWTVGRETHLPIKSPTVYRLLGSLCETKSGKCSQKVRVDVGVRNWTLTAENVLGKVDLQDSADLTKRVHMIDPEGVTASNVNARDVSLEWRWRVQQYNDLNITCQVNVSHGETNTISENVGVGLRFAVLNGLIPNWTYNVTVRCRTAQHFWKWGDWSKSVSFYTRGDVPDALDVWMQMTNDQIIIMWKEPLANQSHGDIRDYEVTWERTTEREKNRTKVAPDKHSLALSQDNMSLSIITVTARNTNGSSSPSTITIPTLNSDRARVNTSWILGSKGGFNLSWSASPAASCGYIVDWCPTFEQSSVEWLKVPPNETNARISSNNFRAGVRYSLSIHACTQGAPVLIDRREGYVREKRIEDRLFKLQWKQRDSDVEVSWDPIPLRKQTAFIRGYVLYCSDINDTPVVTPSSFSDGNPEATSLTARNLKVSSYTFTVKAQTAVGECGTSSIIAILNSQTDNLIKAVLISLTAVFGLLSFITILCYKHWSCIKQKVYPPIPKPEFKDWLMSPGEGCRPLAVDQCHNREADIMDVPELHEYTGAQANGYITQEDMPFVFPQTPDDYYNQALKKCTPPPLTLPTTAIPSQSGLPFSPFQSVFPNPSYNLIMQAEYLQSNSRPEPQEGTPLERSPSGYQPQSNTETLTINQTGEDPGSPMFCVSTYMLLPQSPSESLLRAQPI